MRWLLVLLFSVPLYADSLRVECTLDGFISNTTATKTTGSFTIQGASAGDDAMCLLNASAPTTNSSTATTHRLGYYNENDQRVALRFVALPDSMRTYATNKIIQSWDSAVVTLNISTALTSGDSLTVTMEELRSTRKFAEGSATWEKWEVADNWTTGGAGNTSSDVDQTNAVTTGWLTNATTTAGTDLSFTLNSAAISDTINNNAGVLFHYVAKGGDDGVTSTIIVSTDDNATAGDRPKIIVYYTEADYANFGGSDSLVAYATTTVPAKTPFFTFDISSLATTIDIDSCRWWSYVLSTYILNNEAGAWAHIMQPMKPVNIGNNVGTPSDAGEMNWIAWDDQGANDSNWTTAGALSSGSTCNRSDGSGHDIYLGTDLTSAWSGTGWKTVTFDTMYVRKYLNGGCNNFGLALVANSAGLGDYTYYKIESDETSGTANKTWITIYYHSAASLVTRGTGRFGKSTTGAYLNDR